MAAAVVISVQVQLLNQIQAVKDMDKRIHFALNCGAKSCPPIKVYTPETLEEGLQSAAATFCEGAMLLFQIMQHCLQNFGDFYRVSCIISNFPCYNYQLQG